MEIWVNAATRASALTVWGWHSCHWWHVHGDLCCQGMVCGLFWLDFWTARDTTPRHEQWCISVLSMSNLLCSWGGSVKSCTFPGGLQSGTSPYTVRAIGLWGSLHHKRGAEAFDASHLLRTRKKLMQENIFIVALMQQQQQIIQLPKTLLLEISLFQNWNLILWN